MTILAPLAVQSFRDNNGNPLAGGLLYTYAAGTSTPQTTYQDSAGASPNANPVVLNSRGEAQVWLTAGQAYKFVLQDSLANVIWTVDNISGPPVIVGTMGYLGGLTMSTPGSSATLTVAAGQAADSTNASMMTLAAVTAKTTSAWAIGSATGGLDTGAIANSTWYHFYLIKRVDTGVVDVVFSLNATTPTLPANYTLYRRIGSALTNGSAQWAKFSQLGDEFLWDVPVLDINTAAQGTTAIAYALSSPLGVKVNALVTGYVTSATSAIQVNLYSPDIADTAPGTSTAVSIVPSAAGFGAINASVRTNTSSQIRAIAGGASTTIAGATRGWIDTRGK